MNLSAADMYLHSGNNKNRSVVNVFNFSIHQVGILFVVADCCHIVRDLASVFHGCCFWLSMIINVLVAAMSVLPRGKRSGDEYFFFAWIVCGEETGNDDEEDDDDVNDDDDETDTTESDSSSVDDNDDDDNASLLPSTAHLSAPPIRMLFFWHNADDNDDDSVRRASIASCCAIRSASCVLSSVKSRYTSAISSASSSPDSSIWISCMAMTAMLARRTRFFIFNLPLRKHRSRPRCVQSSSSSS
mmetsp:Transcript_10715/g.30618  ORF Transcript_10715/g.30618 Transcript_10715/m.30618 type:complete len:244 (-) Transcript_10715:614-1345(-)